MEWPVPELPDGPECPELPSGFLQSLRPLFDIMDAEQRGSVHVLEIESRWRSGGGCGGAPALPPGVVQCLRGAAPASGYLTFDRLVAGLRSALTSPGAGPDRGHAGGCRQSVGAGERSGLRGGSSGSVLDVDTRSCSAAEPHSGREERTRPPLGVRNNNLPECGGGRGRPRDPPGKEHPWVRPGEERCIERRVPPRLEVNGHPGLEGQRLLKADRRQMIRCVSEASCDGTAESRRRGRTDRRHTLTSGAEPGTAPWSRRRQEEEAALLKGLETMDRARDWLLRHIYAARRRHMTGDATTWGLGTQEQLLPKLQLVSRVLTDLTSSSPQPNSGTTAAAMGSGLTTRPNVSDISNNTQMVSMLKEQNRQLTKEVTMKSERITRLEQQKSALIKQLFTARSQAVPEAGQLDGTFA